MIRPSNPRDREDWSSICRVATDRDEVLAALGLVHHQYVRSGLAVPNRSGIRVTRYHLLNTTEVMIGKVDDAVVCTLTFVCDTRFGLPMESVYGEEVESRRRLGRRLAEVSCLAERRENGEQSLAVMFQVISLAAQCATRRGVDEVLIAVHPRHGKFYQRFLGFEGIGGLKSYSLVRDNPAIAMALDLRRLPHANRKVYDRLYGIPFPEHELRPRTISLDLLEELCEHYRLEQAAHARRLPTVQLRVPSEPEQLVHVGCGAMV